MIVHVRVFFFFFIGCITLRSAIDYCNVEFETLNPGNYGCDFPATCAPAVGGRFCRCPPGQVTVGTNVIEQFVPGGVPFTGCTGKKKTPNCLTNLMSVQDMCAYYPITNGQCVHDGAGKVTITCDSGYYIIPPAMPSIVLDNTEQIQPFNNNCVNVDGCSVYGSGSHVASCVDAVGSRDITCESGYVQNDTKAVSSFSLPDGVYFFGCVGE